MAFGINFELMDLRSALDFAIGMEEDEQLRYQEFALTVGDPAAAEFFRQMNESESGHRRRLEIRREVLFRHAPTRFDTSLDDEPEEGHEAGSFSAREALEISLAAELKTFQFYAAVIRHVTDTDVRQAFEEIQQESAQHHAAVRQRLDELPR
jgi:rubrerythrin